MRIVFFGTDDFAAAHLKALHEFGYEIVACITPPDKPKGRGMQVATLPVKEFAQKHNIAVVQPASLKTVEIIDGLNQLKADIFIVIAYGKLLPQAVINLPPFGALNVHASLLPKYRGAAPINWAILNGDKETGVTIIQINAKLDAGEMIGQSKVPINIDDNSIILREKLMQSGCRLLLDTLRKIENNQIERIAQKETDVSLAPKLTKELGAIKWDDTAEKIHNQIRGLLPWPSAYTTYQGKMLKILATKLNVNHKSASTPGEVIDVNKNNFTVATGKGSLMIEAVHLADSKPMAVKDFLVGYKIEKGFIF